MKSHRLISLFAALVAVLALSASSHAEEPATFDRELSMLRRYVACDLRAEVANPPAGIREKSIASACKEVARRVDIFRKRWYEKAKVFLGPIVPTNLPKTVVYPFGGADLLHALAVFPDASLITTMSLEWVGDPRAVGTMEAPALMKNLKQQHAFLIKLFQVNHSRTIDLQELNQSPVPAPLVFALTALHMMGYEPITAQWFDLNDKGEVVYLTPSAIAAFDATPEASKQKNRNAFFGNVELRFKKSGVAGAPTQVWRHMRANLHDDQLKGSSVEKYLKAQGTFTAMMKAASYLIWRDDFSIIRDLLLDQMAWMISETSGLDPEHAAAKGFKQDTYGRFTGNMFPGSKKVEKAMIEMWAAQPERALPIQFGYPDKSENNHMLITHK